MKTVVVLSGGLDSCVLLAKIKELSEDTIAAINFNYGSNHNKRERRSAEEICKHYDIQLHEIDLSFTKQVFKSSLLDGADAVPEGHYQAAQMKSTVVPFRNGVMLSIATAFAESNGFECVAIGAHSGDHYIYPDCRPNFIDAMTQSVLAGTDGNVFIAAPFVYVNKANIISQGDELEVPFELTYSCYKGDEIHCGKCGACNERKESFRNAGVIDPTVYKE